MIKLLKKREEGGKVGKREMEVEKGREKTEGEKLFSQASSSCN